MATTYDSLDAFNLLESATVTSLKADTWLGNTANVKTIHEKIRRNGENEVDYYTGSELPAIGVLAVGAADDERRTIGEFELGFRVMLDIWHAVDAEFKEIVARGRRLLRLQTFAQHSESDVLDGIAADGDVQVLDTPDYDYFPPDVDANNGGWIVHGIVFALVLINSAD